MKQWSAKRAHGDPSDSVDYYWAANNAFLTASNLAAVVNSVPGEKVVMAHSLGNMVVSSAFADHGMAAEKYFALNAAGSADSAVGIVTVTAPWLAGSLLQSFL